MRRRREKRGSWVAMPFALLLGSCVEVLGGSGWGAMDKLVVTLGIKTRSSWKRDLRETRRRLKSLVVNRPSFRGAMKEGQRRVQALRKEMISRPECFDRVSQTAEQKRVQISFISFCSFNPSSGSAKDMFLECDGGA